MRLQREMMTRNAGTEEIMVRNYAAKAKQQRQILLCEIRLLHYIECGCVPSLKMEELRSVLTERQLQVITLRWGLDDGTPKTLARAGEALGVTRERIRQIEAQAIRTLRTSEFFRQQKDTDGVYL